MNLIEFPKAIEFDLHVLFPSKSNYQLALIISTELIKIGKPISAVDSMIAAVALNNQLKLVTKDKHFVMVKEVKKVSKLMWFDDILKKSAASPSY